MLTCIILSFKTLFLNDSLHKLDWSNLTSLFRSFSLLFDCCSSFCKSVMKRFHLQCVPIYSHILCYICNASKAVSKGTFFIPIVKTPGKLLLKGRLLSPLLTTILFSSFNWFASVRPFFVYRALLCLAISAWELLTTSKTMSQLINPLTAQWALTALIDFTLSNARRFYSSKGNPLDGKGLTLSHPRGSPLTSKIVWR